MKIIFLPQAQQEFADAFEFYEKQLNDLGKLFSKEIF